MFKYIKNGFFEMNLMAKLLTIISSTTVIILGTSAIVCCGGALLLDSPTTSSEPIPSIIITDNFKEIVTPTKKPTAKPISPKERIEKQLSAYDGSSPKLVKKVKSVLDDEESFKHIETMYKDNKDGSYFIYMTFTSKNKYGATIKRHASAYFRDSDNEMIEFFIEEN